MTRLAALTAAALGALVTAVAALRWSLLSAQPLPVGVDGYATALQVRGLLEGRFVVDDPPLTYLLLLPAAALSDPIVGVKIGVSLLGGLLALPCYFCGRALGGRAAGLLSAAFASTSAGALYLAAELPKTLLAVVVALTLLACALGVHADQRPRRRLIALTLLALAAPLTHALAVVLALWLAAPVVIAAAPRTWRAPLLGLGLALAVVGVVVADGVTLLSRSFRADVDLRLPALDAAGSTPLWLGAEPLIAALLAVIVVVAAAGPWRARALALLPQPQLVVVVVAAASLALAIGCPFLDVADRTGLAFRLRQLAFVPAALLLAPVAAALTRRVGSVVVVVVAVVVAVVGLARAPQGIVITPPKIASAMQRLPAQLPAGAVVVCPWRHLVFLARYQGVDARLANDVNVDDERRFWLLPRGFIAAQGGPHLERALRDVAAQSLHPNDPLGLVLLSDAQWRALLQQVPPDVRARLLLWPTQ